MSLVRQQHEIPAETFDDSNIAAQWARLWNSRLGSANQVQQVTFPNENGCAQAWSQIYDFDLRFVGAFTCNHLRERFIVVMQSASGEPSCVVTGADVSELYSTTSPTPANFGGDGTGWWKVCYVSPNQDAIDFSAVTGSLRFATSFTSEGDLPTGSGNHGDGVALIFSGAQEYTATFGSAHASVSVSMAALPLDAVFFWMFPSYRSIDDITQTKTFHNADDSFDHDETKFNSDFSPVDPNGGTDSSIDWTTDGRDPRAAAITYTMHFDVDATASVFEGACRVLSTAFGCDLRALCE